MRSLEEKGYITRLEEKISITSRYSWSFNMGELVFQYNDKNIELDFTKYRLQIIFKKRHPPKVYVLKPSIPEGSKHIWKDGSLCLYKPSNFQWERNMNIERDLFPSICTWLYHYSIWKKTGNWIGEEAIH